MTSNLLPVWEVFDPRSGRTVGFARGETYATAIGAVSALAASPASPGILLDADLVPIARLDFVPAMLPAINAR